jgi:hypothetical protein
MNSKKIVTVEKGNTDNITWYEDNFFELEAPCYYSIKDIIYLIKKYNPRQKLIVNNVLNMSGLIDYMTHA